MSTRGRSGQPLADTPGLTHAELGRQVQDALAHLHDPVYLEVHPLAQLAASERGIGDDRLGQTLRRTLLEAVESLRPEEDADASVRRGYEILRLRYVEALESPVVEGKMGLGRRQCHREHQRALAAVVSVLRQRWGAPTNGRAPTSPSLGPSVSLPIPVSSFVGREREISEVRALLSMSRLLTLTGMGGSGKSRLALEVATRLVREQPEAYPDGVRFVELASLSEPDLVPQTVAFALGHRDESGQPPLDALVAHLRARRLLLVLDNCEHLLDACAKLAECLLRACPDLRILATSREALGIVGETRYRLPLLGVPEPEQWLSASAVGEYDAVRLFVERARAVRPDFALRDESACSVAEVCWRLDGMPLAIELAAARVRMLTPEQIARRLDDRFRLLTDGSRTAEPRQQTLRGTIDWSHDLLDEPERILFRRLAVFAGGWTLGAAEAVCAGEGIDSEDVLDLLGQLVDRSFVVVGEASGEARYRLLDTVRQYAEGKLAEAGEVGSLRRRHLTYYVNLVERLWSGILGGRGDRRSVSDRLDREHANLLAAFFAGVLESPLTAALLIGDLWAWWRGRVSMPSSTRWVSWLLEQSSDPALAPKALFSLTLVSTAAGDLASARSYAESARRTAREAKDGYILGLATLWLGFVALLQGDNDFARQAYLDGFDCCQRTGDPGAIAFAHFFLGVLARAEGDYTTARAHFEEELAFVRKMGIWGEVSKTLGALARTAWRAGDTAEAWRLMDESLSISQEKDVWYDTVLALSPLLAHSAGERARAWQLTRQGLDGFRRAGMDKCVPQPLCVAGILLIDEGACEQGARLIGAALRLAASARLPDNDVDVLAAGEASLEQARAALGEEAFARALAEGQAMTLEQAVEYALRDEW